MKKVTCGMQSCFVRIIFTAQQFSATKLERIQLAKNIPQTNWWRSRKTWRNSSLLQILKDKHNYKHNTLKGKNIRIISSKCLKMSRQLVIAILNDVI